VGSGIRSPAGRGQTDTLSTVLALVTHERIVNARHLWPGGGRHRLSWASTAELERFVIGHYVGKHRGQHQSDDDPHPPVPMPTAFSRVGVLVSVLVIRIVFVCHRQFLVVQIGESILRPRACVFLAGNVASQHAASVVLAIGPVV
jgi:hypothetical protein